MHFPNEIRKHIIPNIDTGKPICTDQQCNLKPYTWTPVKVTKKGNYLIQTPLHIAQNGIVVQNGIINDSKIWMIDYSDKTVVIPKGYHIGNIEKVKEIFDVDTSKKDKEFRGEMKVNEKEKTEKERLEILLKEYYRTI